MKYLILVMENRKFKDMSTDELLQLLKSKLQSVKNNMTDQLHIKLSDINTKTDITEMKRKLNKYGMIFVTDVIPESQSDSIKSKIVETYNDMFGKRMGGTDVSKVNDITKNADGKQFGNIKFAYLFKQPLLKDNVKQILIDKHNEYMFYNPVFTRVNMNTLVNPENKHMLSVILALTHQKDVMLSWDSTKVATNENGRNNMTIPHLDHYNDKMERSQIILNVEEERNKLFYAIGTYDEDVKEIIKYVYGKNVYETDGFKRIIPGKKTDSDYDLKKGIVDLIKNNMVTAPSRSLIIWKSGVVHAEYVSKKDPSFQSVLYEPDSEYKYKNGMKKQLVIRVIIGTHKPSGISEQGLKKLAVAAKDEFIPHRYLHTKGSDVTENKMHKGSTQYIRRTEYPEIENELITQLQKNMENEDYVNEQFNKLDPIEKHLSGINQDLLTILPTFTTLI
jgi:hypothetical protein